MSEPLVMRVKRLISGSVNGLVDAIENANAEIVMREAIREVDRATDDVRDELARVVASRHQTARVVERTHVKLNELGERARIAVEQGRDDLAEVALGRQLDMEAQLPSLDASVAELAGKQTELEGYIAALQARKREMESELSAYVAAREKADEVAGTPTNPHSPASFERRADKAQQAFERALNGGIGAPGHVKADRETMAKLSELERLARGSRIADRLASLKAVKEAS